MRQIIPRDIWRSRWGLFLNLPRWLLAFVWRSLLFRTTFIAVTGSLGKTTTKDCLAAALGEAGSTAKTQGSSNGRTGIPLTLLRVRPWHRFAVIETGTDRPGGLVRAALLVRPHVAVVVNVARTHTRAYRDLDHIAEEKASLLRFLGRRGVAVLNGDDPRVAAMAGRLRCRVVRFGSGGGNDVTAKGIESRWPGRLNLAITVAGETTHLQTRLVGEHWAESVGAAVATAWSCGLGLRQVAAGVAGVEPFTGRLDPRKLPNGAVVLRDDFNGSVDSFRKAVEVLRSAEAERRILVVSDCSDFRKKPRERLKHYAQAARESAEMVAFIGDRCDYGVARALREGFPPECAHGFSNLTAAAAWLRAELREGDLVLLRGLATDHLARLYYRLLGTVACERGTCQLHTLCDLCPDLGFEADGRDEPVPIRIAVPGSG